MTYTIRVICGSHKSKKQGMIKQGETFTSEAPWHKQFPEKFELVHAEQRNVAQETEEDQSEDQKEVRRLSDQHLAVKFPGADRWTVIDEETGDPVNDKTYTYRQAEALVAKMLKTKK